MTANETKEIQIKILEEIKDVSRLQFLAKLRKLRKEVQLNRKLEEHRAARLEKERDDLLLSVQHLEEELKRRNTEDAERAARIKKEAARIEEDTSEEIRREVLRRAYEKKLRQENESLTEQVGTLQDCQEKLERSRAANKQLREGKDKRETYLHDRVEELMNESNEQYREKEKLKAEISKLQSEVTQ